MSAPRTQRAVGAILLIAAGCSPGGPGASNHMDWDQYVPPTPEQVREEAERLSHRNWAEARGVEHFSQNNCVVHVHAPLEDVARWLAGKGARWERDVLGRECRTNRGLFVFRLRGQAWTQVVEDRRSQPFRRLGRGWERELSEALAARVIGYICGDTAGCVSYSYWDKGVLLEDFFGTGDVGDPESSFSDGSYFTSKLRDLTLADIKDDQWDFTENFFREQDAFEPSLEFEYFLPDLRERRRYDPSKPLLVKNPGWDGELAGMRFHMHPPEIERIDHLDFD